MKYSQNEMTAFSQFRSPEGKLPAFLEWNNLGHVPFDLLMRCVGYGKEARDKGDRDRYQGKYLDVHHNVVLANK